MPEPHTARSTFTNILGNFRFLLGECRHFDGDEIVFIRFQSWSPIQVSLYGLFGVPGTTHTTMKKQNDWIRYAVVIRSGKGNGKMSVVAVDIDAATIRLIELQARKYRFGVV